MARYVDIPYTHMQVCGSHKQASRRMDQLEISNSLELECSREWTPHGLSGCVLLATYTVSRSLNHTFCIGAEVNMLVFCIPPFLEGCQDIEFHAPKVFTSLLI